MEKTEVTAQDIVDAGLGREMRPDEQVNADDVLVCMGVAPDTTQANIGPGNVLVYCQLCGSKCRRKAWMPAHTRTICLKCGMIMLRHVPTQFCVFDVQDYLRKRGTQ